MWAAATIWILVTTLFMVIAVPGECKVYYVCGAVLDSTEKGLILSPGFPNNYPSGSHCVWQFFVPAGSQLVVETLDFDVFESPSDNELLGSYSSYDASSIFPSKRSSDEASFTENSLTSDSQRTKLSGYSQEVNDHNIVLKETKDASYGGEKEMLASHFAIKEQALLNPGLNTSQEGVIFKQAREDQREYPNNVIDFLVPSTAKMTENVDSLLQKRREDETTSSAFNDPSTPPPAIDVCPHDVLYISDLVSFSSRFCGSNSRLNKTLVFGSPVEMIEVIMELITTTDRGRGFAMLFSYQNDTVVTALGMNSIIGEESVILLAVIAAMISFALVLMLVLCLSYRQKICPKRAQEPDLVTQHPVGNQNAALEVNELQLVVPVEDLQKPGLESSCREQEGTKSHQTLKEDPSSFSPTANSDEVFIISSGNNSEKFTFTSFALQERNLKRSVTSPASVSEWQNSDYTSVDLSVEEKCGENKELDPARQRTWSVRTFNNLLTPIPQLQMKWRGRTSSGSFTKLVNNGCTAPCPGKPGRAGSVAQIESSRLYSDSSASNASYPLTSSAQQQRKFPSCNLKKSCFAFLNGSPECVRVEETDGLHENHNLCHKPQEDFTWSTKSTFPRGGRVKEPPLDLEMAKAVFVICEEADDQQPLVLDDQLSTSGYSQSAKKDSGTIKCKADIHSTKPTEVVSELGPWINSPEGYRCQHTADMLTLASADNQSKRNSTDISRHESAFDANSLSEQELTTDRVILKHHTPVCQHAVTSNDLGIPCSSEKTS